MQKLMDKVEKELKQIGERELTINDVDVLDKLVDIYKDLKEVEGKSMDRYNGGYRDGGYRDGGSNYNDAWRIEKERSRYDRPYMDSGRGGSSGNGGNYRMREKMSRIADGMDRYEMGRDRYMHGDSEKRIHDGLEEMMYAICSFVETAMDFAETPQEKEIIRKHIQKMQQI